VKNNGTATALAGMRARAAFADGSVSFGYANAPGPAAALTESIAAADAVFDGLIDNNQLFVDSIAAGDIAIGGLLAGAGIESNTWISRSSPASRAEKGSTLSTSRYRMSLQRRSPRASASCR
jgi:hypothetical protein